MASSTLHVHSRNVLVGVISRQHPMADGHIRETPWLLLHVSGRVDRFATQSEARDEANKAWPRCTFNRSHQ